MNTHEPARHNNFSLLGLAALLTSPLKEAVNTITSLRKETSTEGASDLMETWDTEWFEKFGRPAKDFPEAFNPIAGKSAEEIQAIRKKVISAIYESQAALAETRNEIIHIIANRSLDSGTKSTIRGDLDARFSRLRRSLNQREEALGECNAALSKIFTRRSSDKRTDGRSVHI